MNALEITLLIVGGIIFVLSFLIPAGEKEADKDAKKLIEDEVKMVVGRELESMKGRIDDIVEETVTYAMEKTERSLERVSNEKIMAVNEYSDTVLADINNNHKEVMFLYDMLNDKHKNIKTTVSEVEKTVKEAKQTAKEAVQEVIQKKEPVNEKVSIRDTYDLQEQDDDFAVLIPQRVSGKNNSNKVIKSSAIDYPELDISFMKGSRKNGNNNERILQMHNDGKSNVAIAKDLGLGVGEVKLVIDLFEGI